MARQKAAEAAMGVLEIGAMHYRAVVNGDWSEAESLAHKMAQMSAFIADAHQALQRAHDESEMG